MRYSYLIFCLIAFIGCATNYPSWYIKQEKQDRYIYGVGEGKSLSDAKSNALSDIATQISLEIKSSLDIKNSYTIKNDMQDITKEQKNNINISVEDMELNSIEYVNMEESGGVFYTKARIEKNALISKLNADISSYITQANSILTNMAASSCSFLSPKHRISLAKTLQDANIKAMQIQSLKGISPYLSKLEQLNSLAATMPKAYINNINASDDMLDSALKAEYSKFFNIDSKSSRNYEITQSYTIKELVSTMITLDFSIKDCNNNSIFSMRLESSSRDKKSAIDRLRAQVYKKLLSWQEGDLEI